MGTPNPVPGKLPAIAVEPRGIGLEILLAREKKGRFTKTLQNGSGSRAGQQVGPGKVRAKAKERKEVTAIVRANHCATIGAKETGTAAMLQLAISPTMARKEELKEKEKEQHHCQRKPLRKQRKKSWQW